MYKMEDEADENTYLLPVRNAEYSSLPEKKHCKQFASGEISARDQDAIRKLTIVFFIAIVFMVAEMIGGWIANSIAIFSDALHLLSDVAGYLVSIAAIYMANWTANGKMTWGYKRCEILGAVVSVLGIWVVTVYLVYEAINRIVNKPEVNGKVMFITACLGVTVNIAMGVILITGGHGHSHGIQGHSSQSCNHGHSHGEASKDEKKLVKDGYQADESGSKKAHGHAHGNKEKESHGHGNKNTHGHGHGNSHGAKQSSHGHAHAPKKSSHGHAHAPKKSSHGHGHGDKKESSHGHGAKKESHGHAHGKTAESHGDHHNEDEGHHEGESNINLRAAIVHVVGDLLQSFAVVIAGALIWIDHDRFVLADPICTLIFSVLVMYTTYSIMKDVFEVLMMATPQNIDLDDLHNTIINTSTLITDVDCLHVWAITKGVNAMTCVITVENQTVDGVKEVYCAQTLLQDVKASVARNFDVSHICIEIDQPDHCDEFDSSELPLNHRGFGRKRTQKNGPYNISANRNN